MQLHIVAIFLGLLLSLPMVGISASHAQSASDVAAVKAANDSYYVALSARDISAMEKVWLRSPKDVNIAPPIRPAAHVGWTAIEKTYKSFWATLDELTDSMENPTIRIEGAVAWVHGIENAKRKMKGGELSIGKNFGTSIFVKQDGKWLMVFHQAALIPEASK